MKFILRTSKNFYSWAESKKLETLGFVFKKTAYYKKAPYYKKHGKTEQSIEIEISSLDELIDFYKKWGKIIITEDSTTGEPVIEIYDDWRE